MKKIIFVFVVIIYSSSLFSAPAIKSNSSEALRLMERNRRSYMVPLRPLANKNYYSEVVNSKGKSIFVPASGALRIVSVTEKGAICKFGNNRGLIFVTGIKDLSTAVDGQDVCYNIKKPKPGWKLYRTGRYQTDEMTIPKFSLKNPFPKKKKK